jgi:hypothetical protein
MVTTWVDFKQLKADVAIERVVALYGVQLRRVAGTELRGHARCQHTPPRGVAPASR